MEPELWSMASASSPARSWRGVRLRRTRQGATRKASSWRLFKLAFVVCAAVISAASMVPSVFAATTAHDPCKVLTAEKFSQIMGYATTID